MAHPKSRVSTQRKRKRRTHYKLGLPKIAVCKTTGESHLYHRAYEHEGALYYKGQMVVPAKETRVEEIEE